MSGTIQDPPNTYRGYGNGAARQGYDQQVYVDRMQHLGTIFVAAVGLGIIEQAIVWETGGTTMSPPILFVPTWAYAPHTFAPRRSKASVYVGIAASKETTPIEAMSAPSSRNNASLIGRPPA